MLFAGHKTGRQVELYLDGSHFAGIAPTAVATRLDHRCTHTLFWAQNGLNNCSKWGESAVKMIGKYTRCVRMQHGMGREGAPNK